MAHAGAAATLALLVERDFTVAVAETTTGGLIGNWFTDLPGCSAVFLGGVTAYHNRPKIDILQVPAAVLSEHGVVSEAAAIALAQGVRRAFGSDLAVSETGVAGPTGRRRALSGLPASGRMIG